MVVLLVLDDGLAGLAAGHDACAIADRQGSVQCRGVATGQRLCDALIVASVVVRRGFFEGQGSRSGQDRLMP
ncbi:hypothetical protein DWF74_28020 [Pseudomonas protegens]|nr:hypothetical protein DWF74_28020 [Pseudomonas protegens]